MRRKGSFVVGAALLAGLAGCRPNQDAAAVLQPAPEKATPVSVQTVAYEPMVDQVNLPGSVEAWQEIEVAAEVGGRIARIEVQEGQRVEAAAPPDVEALTRVDSEALEGKDYRPLFLNAVEAALRQDKAIVRLDAAELKQAALAAASEAALRYIALERVQKLHARRAASDAELDEARAAADAALAQYRRALTLLSRCQIASPIAGIVDELPVDAGEYVQAGAVVARVVQVDRLKVVVDVPERDIPYIRVGDRPTVVFDQVPAAGPIDPRVYFVRTTADKRARTFPVEIAVANPQGLIRPGMIARVTFVKRRFEQAIAVPLFAVIPFKGGYSVFVEEHGRARRRQIQVGILEGLRVQVTGGLAPGDRLIVKGQRELQDGKLVEVRETLP